MPANEESDPTGWTGGAPPGFEGVSGEFPDEVKLERRDREAVADHHESLPDDEREDIEATVDDLFSLLGRAHAMGILREFAMSPEPLRFRDLQAELDVSPNTLSARLDEFVAAGLLDRREYDEVPPRVEYEPTETAEALFPAFGYVHFWARAYGLEE